MHIYICKNDIKMNSDDRVRRLLLDYVKDVDLSLSKASLTYPDIRRSTMGKPVFTDRNLKDVHFSVSHSGRYWGCAFERYPIGFDLEDRKGRKRSFLRHERIAQRFFSRKEYDFVCEKGKEAFFSLWVRKEAYAKYTGKGIFSSLSFCMMGENGINNRFKDQDNHFVFCEEIMLISDVKASYCSGQKPKMIIFKYSDREKGEEIGAV